MEALNCEKKDNSKRYYIAKQNTILVRCAGNCDSNIRTLHLGTFVETIGEEAEDTLRVCIIDYSESDEWKGTEWRCHKYDLIPISFEIQKYLLAIAVPQDRIRIALNESLCQDLIKILINDVVWYHPDLGSSEKHLGIVKYIGYVPKLGPGFYFGLDLLLYGETFKTSLLTSEHFTCQHSNGIFVTASNITPYKTELREVVSNMENMSLSKMNSKISDSKVSLNTETIEPENFTLLDDNRNNNRDASSSLVDKKNSVIKRNSSEKNDFKTIDNTESYKNINVGSRVKISMDSHTASGVIRWVGTPQGVPHGKTIAGIELDDKHPLGTDGTYDGVRYFQCRPHKALFTNIEQCSRWYDIRMPKIDNSINDNNFDEMGQAKNSVIEGMVRPICVKGNLESICGKYRGIQGHHNSCYLDATLFSMFTFTCVFDNLLFRPPNDKDFPEYEQVQRVLREEIVNPLRKNMFVSSDRVMKLRTLLERLSSVSGLTSEEKDPEEFLTSLVAQILNAEPFLKLSSGQDAYHYQLFVEKDDQLNLPTVQQLLEQSFLTSDIKLKEVPSCLIIQMPRFGKSFKMYQKIQPTLLLDITDLIEDSPRQCTVCGKLAEFECKECYGQCGDDLESIAFCLQCLEKSHRHEMRTNHEPKKLSVPVEFAILQEHCPVPRLYLELSAVVCIETSHYVCFVKCGPGSDAPWCFFDSMADRKGEQNGYNIPEMVPCPDFPYWLSEEGGTYLTELTDDKHLPEHAKRLLCDAYMCMYQSPDVMMYK